MMNRIQKIVNGCIIIILLFAAGGILIAQEVKTEEFLQELERLMLRDGWEVSETGSLNRLINTYRYQNLEGVEPELVAFALQYAGSRKGDPLEVTEMAVLASQVMHMAGEMAALGFDTDDITQAALNGVREMLAHREQLRVGEDSPEDALMLQEQIRLQVRDSQSSELKSRIQNRTRISNPHGPEEWTPPGPAGTPGGIDPAGNPGSGPGPGVDSPGGGQQTGN